MEMIGMFAVRDCAAKMRSNGSRWSASNRAAFTCWRI